MFTGLHPVLEAAADELLADSEGVFTESQMIGKRRREVFVQHTTFDRHSVESLQELDHLIWGEAVRDRTWLADLVPRPLRPECIFDGCTVRPFRYTNGMCSLHQPPKVRTPQTHCKRGHDLAQARIRSNGQRQCRQCENDRNKARRVEQRLARPPKPKPEPKQCSREGCAKDAAARGMCKTDYANWLYWSKRPGRSKDKPLPPGRKPNPDPAICDRVGCDIRARSLGLCNKHQAQYHYYRRKAEAEADLQRAQTALQGRESNRDELIE